MCLLKSTLRDRLQTEAAIEGRRERHCGCGLRPLTAHCLISQGKPLGISPGSSGIGASRHHPQSVDRCSPLIFVTPIVPPLGDFCLTVYFGVSTFPFSLDYVAPISDHELRNVHYFSF